jgi:hypothetical protein
MPLPSTIDDLSTTAALNYPSGADAPSVLDDTQRAHAAFIAQLRDSRDALATATGSASVGNQHPGTGAVLRTAADKFDEYVTVTDFGADKTGVTNSTTAFTNAGSVGTHVTVVVPGPATYLLNTAPAPTGKVTWIIEKGATFTGAGAPYMSGSGAGRQYLDAATTATDFASFNIRRNANHTGGTPGYVNSGFRVDHYVSSGVTNFEWSITSQLDNSATAGENTSLYAVSIKRSGAGATIGGVVDIEDEATNPTTSSVGLEVDHRCNGTDNNNARVALDIYGGLRNLAGAAAVISFGARIQSNGDLNVSFKTGYGFETGLITQVAFDASTATTSLGGLKLKQDQSIILSSDNTKTAAHDGTGLALAVSGSKKLRLNDAGSISLNDLRCTIPGTFATGSAAPVLTANKPGASTAIATWLDIVVDGVTLTFPAWPKS